MTARPYRVLLVARDTVLLRRLSRFLKMFGFHVFEASHLGLIQTWLVSDPPEFLVVDRAVADKQQLQSIQSSLRGRRLPLTYTLMLADRLDREDLREALAAGVDDVLSRPVAYGELLSRLRAGARAREFYHRAERLVVREPLTQLLSEAAFRERLRTEASRPSTPRNAWACVVFNLDFMDSLNRHIGRAAVDRILRELAAMLLRHSETRASFPACFGEGTFAALLENRSDGEAMAWAEELRQAIENTAFPENEAALRVTVSFGVAGGEPKTERPDEVVDRAKAALRTAKTSGRNLVCRCGEHDGETREWETLATEGKLFETTTARDVMVPCTIMLNDDEPALHAAATLESTGPGDVPVVNEKGVFLGLLDRSKVEDISISQQTRPVKDLVDRSVARFGENDRLSAVLEYFGENDAPSAVIVRNERPVGIVARDDLVALSEPLSDASFATTQPPTFDPEYLVVASPSA